MGACVGCINCLDDFVESDIIQKVALNYDNDLPNIDNPDFNNLNLGCFTNFIKDFLKAIKNDGVND